MTSLNLLISKTHLLSVGVVMTLRHIAILCVQINYLTVVFLTPFLIDYGPHVSDRVKGSTFWALTPTPLFSWTDRPLLVVGRTRLRTQE